MSLCLCVVNNAVVADSRINPAYVLNDRLNAMQAEIAGLQSKVEKMDAHPHPHVPVQQQLPFDPQQVISHLQSQFPNNFKAEWVHILNFMKEMEANGGIR